MESSLLPTDLLWKASAITYLNKSAYHTKAGQPEILKWPSLADSVQKWVEEERDMGLQKCRSGLRMWCNTLQKSQSITDTIRLVRCQGGWIDCRVDVDNLLKESCYCTKWMPQHGCQVRHNLSLLTASTVQNELLICNQNINCFVSRHGCSLLSVCYIYWTASYIMSHPQYNFFFSFLSVLVPSLVVISGLWVAQCWPMSTAMYLHCIYGCHRVVCLVVAYFYKNFISFFIRNV